MQQTSEPTASSGEAKSAFRKWAFRLPILFVVLAGLIRAFLAVAGEGISDESISSPWSLSLGVALALILLVMVSVWVLSTLHEFKRGVIGVVILAGLVLLFYAEENIRGRLAWRQFKARWEAKGERFDRDAMVPPKVPDDQNFALAPVVLSSYANVLDRFGHRVSAPNLGFANRLEMPLEIGSGGPTNGIGSWHRAMRGNLEAWQLYYRKLALTTNLFPVPPQAGIPATDVLLALSVYDETLGELRQAAALPASRFPLNYDCDVPAAILLPHLAPMKGCAKVLQLRAFAELEAGKSDAALADVILALRLIQNLRSEPFLITALVRISMWSMMTQTIWEGLAAHRWTDAQLADLEQQLAALDFVADYRIAMSGENVFQAASIDYLREHPEQFENLCGSSDDDKFGQLAVYLIPSGWYYQNQLRNSQFILERLQPAADVTRQSFSTGGAAEADTSLSQMRPTPYNKLSRIFLPGLTGAGRKFARAQTEVSLCRTACALERRRLAGGKYPESLDGLAPQFIARVPNDPVGGQPLHYRLTAEGSFLLYSVGWNNRDDQGTPGLTKNGGLDFEHGDLVWRYPDAPKP